MTADVSRVLIIEADPATDRDSVLTQMVNSLGFAPWLLTLNDTQTSVGSMLDAEPMPLLAIIAPGVGPAIALGRELQSIWPSGHLIIVRHPEDFDALQREVSRLPMIAKRWLLAQSSDPALDKMILESAAVAQRRLRLRTTLDRANMQIASAKPIDSIDYRRLLISEHYLANFLAQASEAIVALDVHLHVLYWNLSAERMFGLSMRDVLNLPVDRLPFWSPIVDDAIRRASAGESAVTEEVFCQTPAGQIAVDIHYSSVLDEASGFIGVSLSIRDVSVRLQKLNLERASRDKVTRAIDTERRRLIGLFDQAPGFMAVTRGPEHVLEMANQAYYKTFGKRTLVGNSVHAAFPELADAAFFRLRDTVYRSGEPFVGKGMALTIQREPNATPVEIYIDFVYQPIIEADGTVSGIFCQGNDVTEQKLAQDALVQHQMQLEELVADRTAELRKTETALVQSQKLEAIGKLTGGVAHDFNNILQVIRGNLELLSLGLPKEGTSAGRIKSAAAAVDRGSKLSSQLLAFARRQPLQPVSTDIGRILRELDDLLRRVLGESVEIETIIGGGLWTALVDRNQLENVILNLAINARDAMDGSGKLTIEAGNAMLDDYYMLQHPDVPTGQYVVLAISDTGTGMSAEVMERAFEPFFTTKREGEGTGLGLSMAYGFVKQSGGHIKLYSEPGNGTTVKIYLPRNYEPELSLPDMRSVPVTGGSETILVVEDDAAVQATVVDMLIGLGYKVLKAQDAQSALIILHSGVPIDMVFTDVVMPGPVRSTDLVRQAKEAFPDIEVLFTSGYTQNAIVHGGRLDPGVELISKPYRREDLARKIRHMFRNREQVTEMRTVLSEETVLPQADQALRILVVEDVQDSQDMLCEILGLLGHTVKGVSSAEEAMDQLVDIDVLLTDINLPGMSGIELARKAMQISPEVKIIFASGGSTAEIDIGRSFHMLPKPYTVPELARLLAEA